MDSTKPELSICGCPVGDECRTDQVVHVGTTLRCRVAVERDAATFWCPRRIENGAMPGPNGEPPVLFPNPDNWRSGSDKTGRVPTLRTCSYCGSVHPDDLFAYIEAEGEIGPTDKSYKIYLPHSPQKFYFQHFDDDQRKRFIDLLNQRKVKLGYPGYFYTMPFFIQVAGPGY